MATTYWSMVFGLFFYHISTWRMTVMAYSDGATLESCSDMRYEHNPYGSFQGAAYFQIKMVPFDNEKYEISIVSVKQSSSSWFFVGFFLPSMASFLGFMVQVRPINDLTKAIGTFELNNDYKNDVKFLDCWEKKDTVTQNFSSPRYNVSMFWYPPENFFGEVYPTSSVVQNYDYGMIFHKPALSVVVNTLTTTTTTSTTTTTTTQTTTSTTTESTTTIKTSTTTKLTTTTENSALTSPPTNLTSNFDMLSFMMGPQNQCQKPKDCVLYPPRCDPNSACLAYIKWTVHEDYISLQLWQSLLEFKDDSYLAAGLSLDDSMDGDFVVACAQVEGSVSLKTSWNKYREDSGEINEPIKTDKVELLGSFSKESSFFCEIKIVSATDIEVPLLNGKSYMVDLTRPMYILLAGGVFDDGLVYHGAKKTASDAPIILANMNKNEASPSTSANLLLWIFISLLTKSLL